VSGGDETAKGRESAAAAASLSFLSHFFRFGRHWSSARCRLEAGGEGGTYTVSGGDKTARERERAVAAASLSRFVALFFRFKRHPSSAHC